MLTYSFSSKYLICEKLLLYYIVLIISKFVRIIYSDAYLC